MQDDSSVSITTLQIPVSKSMEDKKESFAPLTPVASAPKSGSMESDDNYRKLAQINLYFGKFTENGVISKERFLEAIGDKHKSFLAARFFDSLDTDGSGTLDIIELNKGAQRLLAEDEAERVNFIFSLYDFDGDGIITFDELLEILKASTLESKMEISEEKLEDLTKTFIDEMDKDGDGTIDLNDMHLYLHKNSQLIKRIATESISWLMPPPEKKPPKKRKIPLTERIKNNVALVAFIAAVGLINVVLFFVNCYNYRDSNWWIIFARGFGMCLDFDVCLVLLLPLKRFITTLRMSVLRTYLPLDYNIYLHMLFAGLIVVLSTLHTLTHIGNAVKVAESDYNVTVGEFIFTTKAGVGWVAGLAPITGVVLVVVLAIMAFLSMPFIRRKGHFGIFYWSHTLYFTFFILCILHATHFWKWFLLPGVIFVYEMITYYKFKRGTIHEFSLLPSKVVKLVINPDERLRFSAGDYVYICIPDITRSEWHPFTISSSPHLKDRFTLHIRAVGSWTNRLKEYVASKNTKKTVNSYKIEESNAGLSQDEEGSLKKSEKATLMSSRIKQRLRKITISKKSDDPILISGPFGSPCREIFETSHPILVGSGIGVTPFASILQHLFHRIAKTAVKCPKCEHRWCDREARGKPIVDRVDFVWINRDSKSFEWFAELLFQIEHEFANLDMRDVFKMHLYMTGAHKMEELRGMGIQVALDLNYKKTKTDCLTGLSTKTMAGRPNFDQLFKDISESSPFEKKVFMCGSPMLAKDVKYYSQKYGFGFSKEYF